MKTIFLSTFILSALLISCSSSKDTAKREMMQVVNATFQHWSESVAGSDSADRGTDLRVTMKNLPNSYSPAYIIFRGKKSYAAEVVNRNNNQTVIQARIIHQSAVLKDKSTSANVSDRLVFKKSDGETGFIEINDWERIEG